MEEAPAIAAKPGGKVKKTIRVIVPVVLALLLLPVGALLLGSAVHMMSPCGPLPKVVRAAGDIETLKIALTAYEALGGTLPTTAQGLQALVKRPTTEPLPRMWSQGMDSLPKDPWNNDYHYERPGKHNPNGFDLYSAGRDKIVGTGDDVGNWESEGKWPVVGKQKAESRKQ